MSAKTEIERRLRSLDYKKISKNLFNKSFDDLSEDEYLDILKIADIYGSKYKKIFKLKDTADIRTITSNLMPKSYSPCFTEHDDLSIISLSKTDTSFIIYLEFYTLETIWKVEPYGAITHKVPYQEKLRRIMIIEKENLSNYIIVSIDPVGEGAAVYKKIDENFRKLNDKLNLNFYDFLDMIEVDKALFQLAEEGSLIPKVVSAIDETTKRVKSVQAHASKDNIKNEDIYKSCITSDLTTGNIKMKFNKESIEIFGNTLVKISTNANKGQTDELTTKITSIL
ncbi:MAG: hypothetical protein PHQ70_12365 [Arcobacter sp.]|jgi:hypothetical protein|uniref:hypothetical protein n=1 Tax=Arcobacter sp. TaxID=1872629 RepID=UPI002588C253|nr:hypothetical protein [Arcobacter sp.]MDD3009641.1 hypothetical protein [Arcobacter sp.]MDY0052827.1 hypothetical protein [Aliarcobacter sp.]